MEASFVSSIRFSGYLNNGTLCAAKVLGGMIVLKDYEGVWLRNQRKYTSGVVRLSGVTRADGVVLQIGNELIGVPTLPFTL